MALNIKNAEVERLAREVAQLSGETKTEAIRKALEERKACLKSKVVMGKGERARRYLQDEVWPALGGMKVPTKSEIEGLLGYGPAGV